MYKKIILLSICTVLALSAQAQRFKGGLHGGLLATQVDGDGHGGYKKAGLFVGAFTNLPFPEKKIQFQFELNYAQKGSAANPVYRMALHQVEPTALIGWDFWKKLHLEAGLGFNILAASKEFVSQTLIDPKLGSNFYLFHLEGIAGLGYRFNDRFGVSFRSSYSSPIGRANKKNNNRPSSSGYMYNNCLLFRVYYQF